MIVRFFCKSHNVPLENCGNGRAFFPTMCLDPIISPEGWMELDMSEFFCPYRAKLEEATDADPNFVSDCQFVVEFADGNLISENTELTMEGWKYEPPKDQTPPVLLSTPTNPSTDETFHQRLFLADEKKDA